MNYQLYYPQYSNTNLYPLNHSNDSDAYEDVKQKCVIYENCKALYQQTLNKLRQTNSNTSDQKVIHIKNLFQLLQSNLNFFQACRDLKDLNIEKFKDNPLLSEKNIDLLLETAQKIKDKIYQIHPMNICVYESEKMIQEAQGINCQNIQSVLIYIRTLKNIYCLNPEEKNLENIKIQSQKIKERWNLLHEKNLLPLKDKSNFESQLNTNLMTDKLAIKNAAIDFTSIDDFEIDAELIHLDFLAINELIGVLKNNYSNFSTRKVLLFNKIIDNKMTLCLLHHLIHNFLKKNEIIEIYLNELNIQKFRDCIHHTESFHQDYQKLVHLIREENYIIEDNTYLYKISISRINNTH